MERADCSGNYGEASTVPKYDEVALKVERRDTEIVRQEPDKNEAVRKKRKPERDSAGGFRRWQQNKDSFSKR